MIALGNEWWTFFTFTFSPSGSLRDWMGTKIRFAQSMLGWVWLLRPSFMLSSRRLIRQPCEYKTNWVRRVTTEPALCVGKSTLRAASLRQNQAIHSKNRSKHLYPKLNSYNGVKRSFNVYHLAHYFYGCVFRKPQK